MQIRAATQAFQSVEGDALRQADQLLTQSTRQSAKSEKALKQQALFITQEIKNPVGLATLSDAQQKHESGIWQYLTSSPSHSVCQPSSALAKFAKWRSI